MVKKVKRRSKRETDEGGKWDLRTVDEDLKGKRTRFQAGGGED